MVIESGFFGGNQSVDTPIKDYQFSEIQELAQGSYCRLLRAKRQGQWWVLKCLKTECASEPFYSGLLQKEYDILTRLQYPNIVRAVALEMVDSLRQCIVMEYVSGVSLDAYVQETGVSRRERRQLFLQLLDAVEYVHSQQIVHRDLKPQNILVADNGRYLKLIDFGLSDADNFAVLKQPAGTLRYVSPEQQQSAVADVRNDVYSLGVILDELHLGKRYGRVVRRCLSPADGRYASVTEMRRALLRAERVTAFFRSLVALLVVCVLAGAFLQFLPRGVKGEAQMAIPMRDTIVVRQTVLSSEQSNDNVHVVQTRQGTTVEHDTFTEAYNVGKAKIDNFMNECDYEQLMCDLNDAPIYGKDEVVEAATAQKSFHNRYSTVMEDTWSLVERLSKQSDLDLTIEQKTTLYAALVDYAQKKYLNKLADAFEEYMLKRK